MKMDLTIDVATLDAPHRRALEEVIGRELATDQQLIIRVLEAEASTAASRPAQTLEDWTKVYEGLSEQEIDEIDQIIKTRADLTRELPF